MDQPSTPSLLRNLITLSKIDASLTAILYERRKFENDLKARKEEVRISSDRKARAEKALDEKKEVVRREERAIREENEKLIARRKALTTFSNYKLQQAAEKEIEGAARHLSLREEALLQTFDEVENLEKAFTTEKESYNKNVQAYDSVVAEMTEVFTSLEDREARKNGERQEVLPNIPKKEYTLYENIHKKFPQNPVVPVHGNACSGCFMQVGPQIMVQMARGDTLTRCPGCGRIVFPEESKEE